MQILPELKIFENKENIKYILFDKHEVVSDEIRTYGYFNKEIIDFADNVIKKFRKEMIIIDVGAGLGSFTVPLALKHQFHRFVCLEPIKCIFWQLCANCLINGASNVRNFNVMVSNSIGPKRYYDLDYINSNNFGSFSFDDDINEKRGTSLHQNQFSEYNVLTLNATKYNENVCLIKITVCGMELEVLEGMSEIVQVNDNPPILMELWNNDWFLEKRNACLQKLNEYGYAYIYDWGNYIFACKTKEHYDLLTSNAEYVEKLGGYDVLEEYVSAKDIIEEDIEEENIEMRNAD